MSDRLDNITNERLQNGFKEESSRGPISNMYKNGIKNNCDFLDTRALRERTIHLRSWTLHKRMVGFTSHSIDIKDPANVVGISSECGLPSVKPIDQNALSLKFALLVKHAILIHRAN